MSLFPAFLDTCVLYPYYLADCLLSLADVETYRPLWSADVLTELRRNLIENASLEPSRVDRRITAMCSAFPDAEVAGYEYLVPRMNNDAKDHHVLAAAVRGGAEIIVTANVRDFPDSACEPYGITIVHPDDFLLDQLDLYPHRVIDCLSIKAASYNHGPSTLDELAECLARCGVPDFARMLRRCDRVGG